MKKELDDRARLLDQLQEELQERRKIEKDLLKRESILEATTFAAEKLLETADWRINIDLILEHLGKTINASHAYLFEHQIGADNVEYSLLKYEWTANGYISDFDNPYFQKPNPINLDENSTDHSLRMGEMFMGNSSTFHPSERDRLINLGVKAMVEVPLFVNGKWWGTIGFDDFENEREWDKAEVGALKIAAGILGAAIQRQKAETAVRESERIYRQAIEAADEVPYYLDYESGQYLFMGEGIRELTGYSPHEINLKIWKDMTEEIVMLDEAKGLSRQDAGRLVRQGKLKIWKSDQKIRGRDGQARWVTDRAIELFNDKKISYAAIGILQDITERKSVETNLRKRESILEAVTFAAEQFLKAPDWREKIDAVLERLGKEFNASHAYLFEKHSIENGEIRSSLKYEWTAPGQKSDIDNPAYQNTPMHEVGYENYYQILDRGEPFVGSASKHAEVENFPLWPFGIKALLEMRIIVNGSQWGMIGFDDVVNDREWNDMEVDVLRVSANVLGAAIKRQMDDAVLKNELTERKRAEQALMFSEEKFSKAFHATPVLMTIENDKGVFIDVNRAFMDAFGLERKDIIGYSGSDLNIFYDPADARVLQQTIKEKGFLKDFELRFRRKSNEMGVAMLSSEKFLMDNGEYVLTSGLDITERKQAEAEREELIEELEAKNGELERFTYTVSHDLKSPLVTINGFLSYLEHDALSGNTARLKQDINRIQDAVNKMQRLLSELLKLSRVGRMVNAPEICAFEELINEALDIVHGQVEASHSTVQIQPSLPAVYGDKPRLIEVLQNMLDNAAKYIGKQEHPLIEIGCAGNENGKLIFYVKDNGIGIAPEHHERIFGLFNKLDATTEGTGVGLALVKRIIEVHGGRIWVESAPEKGSTFFFTLPHAPDQ